ncbi:MAG TPA: helix-turn-helix domain-containing protein [Tepidisphaeraceae bacterium]|jgi:DNA-binding transcriptional regulator YiaG
MKTRKQKSRGTQALLRSLEELEACVREGVRPEDRFPSRTVFQSPKPGKYSPAAVADLRKRLGVSQAGFAELIGVSRILVQGWERGVRRPSPLACRLLDTINHDPAAWLLGLRKTRRAG